MDKAAGIVSTADSSEFNLCIKNCTWNGKVDVVFKGYLDLKFPGPNGQWLNTADNKPLFSSGKYFGIIHYIITILQYPGETLLFDLIFLTIPTCNFYLGTPKAL